MDRGFRILLVMLVSVAFMSVAFFGVAAADIVQWQDDSGVTHYTNLQGEIPSEQAVQVVVDEQIWVPKGAAVPEAAQDPPPAPPAQPPADSRDEILRAYVAGLESGLSSTANSGGGVYINGPLAVTVAPPESYSSYAVPGYAGYAGYLPGYAPLVTTSVIAPRRGPLRGRFGTDVHQRSPYFRPSISPAGRSPIGAAGPPPIGAAGRPPIGAAGRPPTGGQLLKVSGGRSLH